MTHRGTAARSLLTDTNTPTDGDAYSIVEFCRRHRISISIFYKLRREMPATFRVGQRVLISKEAAAEWRRKREQLTAAG